MILKMISPQQWGADQNPAISSRRVRQLCEQGRIVGAKGYGTGNRRIWEIPWAAERLPPAWGKNPWKDGGENGV